MLHVIEADLSHGSCPIHVFGDADSGDKPTALLFMDAFGPRPALYERAEEIAEFGWRVVLPDLFYADRPYRRLSPASLFSGGEDRQRLHTMVADLDHARVEADVGALLDVVVDRFGANRPLAAIGYCLGGRYALTAATLSPQVRYAASIHGSQLAPKLGESAHHHFDRTSGRIYIGVAEHDPTFNADEQGRLAAALRESGAGHMIESYQATAHGFALSDLPVFDAAATSRHLRRLIEGLTDSLN